MERYPEEQYVNSLIGFGSRFKGDIEIDGLFRIDGDFSGSIKTEGKVLVGTHGRADCTVNARVVVIGGVFSRHHLCPGKNSHTLLGGSHR
jgi:cytoskeletal protein CcmA (bactofilin family)